MRLKALAAIVALASVVVVGGCARTETFNITVRNDTPSPVTLALTKDGPPFERVWAAPEELAVESPQADEQHSYLLLPAGREADVPAVTGRFDGGTRGYLRVYRGDLGISDMSAISRNSPNRLDLPLQPGANRFVIGDVNGRLVEGGAKAAASTAP